MKNRKWPFVPEHLPRGTGVLLDEEEVEIITLSWMEIARLKPQGIWISEVRRERQEKEENS